MYGPPIPGLPAESCPFAALPWAPGGPSLAAGSQVVKDHPPAGQAARPADPSRAVQAAHRAGKLC